MPINLSFGADPEFFIVDRKTNEPISPHYFFGGTKYEPIPLEGGSVHVDGLAVELGIDPVTNPVAFQKNFEVVFNQVVAMLPPELKLSNKSTAWFTEESLAIVPPENLELGCMPDYDAYNNGEANPLPSIIKRDGRVMRTAAGHIHIGWTTGVDIKNPGHIKDCIILSRALDRIIGPLLAYIDPTCERAQMYGKLGCFRPKSYGMEYRSPSCAWFKNPALIFSVLNGAQTAFRYVQGNGITINSTAFQKRPSFNMVDVTGAPLPLHRLSQTELGNFSSCFSYEVSVNRLPGSFKQGAIWD